MNHYYKDESATLYLGDCRDVLASLPESSVDSIVTDPPYELGFMGKKWDGTGIANSIPMWREALRILKPGGHLLAFSGSRTYHRMTCAIEDAGFEIRDQIMWVYGSGFPKSLDVSKAIDKAAGAQREVIEMRRSAGGRTTAANPMDRDAGLTQKFDPITAPATDAARQWEGWGTALKPAHEPICMARKPLSGTVAQNVVEHGTGAMNIDICRVSLGDDKPYSYPNGRGGEGWHGRESLGTNLDIPIEGNPLGRWPANLIHDGSDEVLDAFPDAPGQQGDLKETGRARPSSGRFGDMGPPRTHLARDKKAGSTNLAVQAGRRREATNAARFFYCAKTTKADRGEGNNHPTVKPTALMRYLVRLVTPVDGTVLDMFAGSGSTGKATVLEGFTFIGCDMTEEYLPIQVERIKDAKRLVADGV